jgi:hypothetical protein
MTSSISNKQVAIPHYQFPVPQIQAAIITRKLPGFLGTRQAVE